MYPEDRGPTASIPASGPAPVLLRVAELQKVSFVQKGLKDFRVESRMQQTLDGVASSASTARAPTASLAVFSGVPLCSPWRAVLMVAFTQSVLVLVFASTLELYEAAQCSDSCMQLLPGASG